MTPYTFFNQLQPFFPYRVLLIGTLAPDVITFDKQVPYRRRGHRERYQNVLPMCDIEMVFSVLVGKELHMIQG